MIWKFMSTCEEKNLPHLQLGKTPSFVISNSQKTHDDDDDSDDSGDDDDNNEEEEEEEE